MVAAEMVVNAVPLVIMAETIVRAEPPPIMMAYATPVIIPTAMIAATMMLLPKDGELVRRCYEFIKNTNFWVPGEQVKPSLSYTPLESLLVVLYARMRLQMGLGNIAYYDAHLGAGLVWIFPLTRPESLVHITPYQWRSFEAVVDDFCNRMMMHVSA